MRRGRTRHQQGWITDGSRSGSYQLHWTEYILGEDGKERRVHRSEMIECKRKYQAQERLDEIVGKLNPSGATKRDGTVTLTSFIDNRWLPLKIGRWREGSTTRERLYQIGLIKSRFGDCALDDLDKIALQIWLNDCAKKYSRDLVLHLKSLLKSIGEEAVDQEYLVKNPARKLTTPITKEIDQTVIDWESYRSILARIPKEKDRLIVKVAAVCAVRPEELFAFKWKHLEKVDERLVLEVEDTVYRGKLRPYAKTEGSRNTVILPRGLDDELLEWRKRSPFGGDDDFIFANGSGQFMDAGYFIERVLEPIKTELKLAALNFRILRRTFATHAQKWGSTTSISRQLRHTRTATTTKHYIKPLDAEVFNMVDAVYEEMMGEVKGRVQ